MDLCKDVLLIIISKCDWKTRLVFGIKPKKLIVDPIFSDKLTKIFQFHNKYFKEIKAFRKLMLNEDILITNIKNINTYDFIELSFKCHINIIKFSDKFSYKEYDNLVKCSGYNNRLVNWVFDEYDHIHRKLNVNFKLHCKVNLYDDYDYIYLQHLEKILQSWG